MLLGRIAALVCVKRGNHRGGKVRGGRPEQQRKSSWEVWDRTAQARGAALDIYGDHVERPHAPSSCASSRHKAFVPMVLPSAVWSHDTPDRCRIPAVIALES